MPRFSVDGMSMAGVAAAVPSNRELNVDYNVITEMERKLLIKTTGIATRHVAPPGLTTADLCEQAASGLMDALKWRREEVDLLIFVSQTPDYLLPATSVILQEKLMLRKSAAAFDINLGCSGYVYGLSVIASMMSTGGFRKALLLAGDISTQGLNRNDKSTWPLFGDAGTATAMIYDSSARNHFSLQSDGSGWDSILVPDGGMRSPINEASFVDNGGIPGVRRKNMQLKGLDVFNFSVREVPLDVEQLLKHNELNTDEIDFFVFHQANLILNETIRKKLRIPAEKFPYSLKDFGNTSSASIPLTIVSRLAEETESPKKWIFSGFGVGLSWGTVYLETRSLFCLPLIYV